MADPAPDRFVHRPGAAGLCVLSGRDRADWDNRWVLPETELTGQPENVLDMIWDLRENCNNLDRPSQETRKQRKMILGWPRKLI